MWIFSYNSYWVNKSYLRVLRRSDGEFVDLPASLITSCSTNTVEFYGLKKFLVKLINTQIYMYIVNSYLLRPTYFHRLGTKCIGAI